MNIEEKIIFELLTIIKLVKRQKNTEGTTEKEAPSIVQLMALKVLSEKEEINVNDFAEDMNISMPSASSLIERLVKLNYVKRVHNEKDRRVVNIKITESGKNMIEKIEHDKNDRMKKILSSLSDEDKQALFEIMKKISTNLKLNLENK